ncbi:hypothetical protein HJC23_003010 [Cyclotella cryptica]|uniref:Uncharacterized protein n=1 Tax=Cyclotella cryptica TaxID=29204 RepID=A0ABD3PTE4_9STRA
MLRWNLKHTPCMFANVSRRRSAGIIDNHRRTLQHHKEIVNEEKNRAFLTGSTIELDPMF